MNWLMKILKSGNLDKPVPSIQSIQFDKAGWVLARSKSQSQEWLDNQGDSLSIRLVPTDYAECLDDPEGLRAHFRKEAQARNGGIVAVDIIEAAGIRLLRVINKFERGHGYDYDGLLILPLKGSRYEIMMRSKEHGTTGMREAVVTDHLLKRGDFPLEDLKPNQKIRGWFNDPYDSVYDESALYSKADDERFDALFPNHPLSKIRSYLGIVQKTLKIDQSIARFISQIEPKVARTPRVLVPTETVATLYLSVENYDIAEALIKESIAEFAKNGKAQQSVAARQMVFLGFSLEGQGRYEEAEHYLASAVDIFEAEAGDSDFETAHASVNLARIYTTLNKYDEAEPLFRKSLKVFEQNDPGSNSGVALNGLGLVCNARGDYADAITHFAKALEIFQRVHGPEFYDCATVLRNMALSFQRMNDPKRAEELLHRAGEIEEKQGIPN